MCFDRLLDSVYVFPHVRHVVLAQLLRAVLVVVDDGFLAGFVTPPCVLVDNTDREILCGFVFLDEGLEAVMVGSLGNAW